MLRDNLVGLITPMQDYGTPASHDRSACLETPRPAGVESSLTGRSSSPFQAEPRHLLPLGLREHKPIRPKPEGVASLWFSCFLLDAIGLRSFLLTAWACKG